MVRLHRILDLITQQQQRISQLQSWEEMSGTLFRQTESVRKYILYPTHRYQLVDELETLISECVEALKYLEEKGENTNG